MASWKDFDTYLIRNRIDTITVDLESRLLTMVKGTNQPWLRGLFDKSNQFTKMEKTYLFHSFDLI